jgi:pyruvate formate lyase activating enzyme
LDNFRAALAGFSGADGALHKSPKVLPRIPVIPGYNDSPEDAAGFASLLNETGATEVQLLPFHQFGQNKYHLLGLEYSLAEKKALHPEDLEAFRAVFEHRGVRAFF